MTPADRVRLAEALTAATGHEWRAGRDVCRREADGLPPLSIDLSRRDSHYAIADSYAGEFIEIVHRSYVGRGWVGRFVSDVLPALDRARAFRSYRERSLLAALNTLPGPRWDFAATRGPDARCVRADGVRVSYPHREHAVYVCLPGGPLMQAGDLRDCFGPGYWRIVASAVANAIRMHAPEPPPAPSLRRVLAFRALLAPNSGACESERAQAAAHLARLEHP